MSASREKKLRQDPTPGADPKTFKELEQAKAEKRSNLLYSVIGVLFLVAVVACLIWKSNIISRSATAVTIDGEKYTAAEVSFYYQNVYRSFLQNNSYFISYLGLDTGSSLKGQTVNATAASMLGVEEGSSWHDYMMDNTIKQMTMIQNGLKEAEAKGFQYPAGVKTQYDDTMQALKDTAVGSGTTVKKYLQQNLGSTMTEKVYGQELLRTLQYQAYANAYSDELTYSDQEIQDAYNADPCLGAAQSGIENRQGDRGADRPDAVRHGEKVAEGRAAPAPGGRQGQGRKERRFGDADQGICLCDLAFGRSDVGPPLEQGGRHSGRDLRQIRIVFGCRQGKCGGRDTDGNGNGVFQLGTRQFRVDGGGLCHFQLAFGLCHVRVRYDAGVVLVLCQFQRLGQQFFAFFKP